LKSQNLPDKIETHLVVKQLYSYIYQLNFAIESEPHRILYVGGGTGVAPYLLSRCSGNPEIVTLDIDERYKPDIIGSVLDIPFEDNRFDVTVCCQVLEHLPFDSFLPALCEMYRVTKDRLVLSLPDCRFFCGFRIKIPLINIAFQLNFPRFFARPSHEKRLADTGHYWEIELKRTPFRKVKKAIQDSGWIIDSITRVYDQSYHTFFYLHKLG
jgi:ubiquinone/menaquinone biosynthesis C-methylase UbiE